MFIEESQLKNFIIESGLVSRKDLLAAEKIAAIKQKSLGEILVNEGRMSENDLRKTQAHILGIPFVDLKNQRVHFTVLSLIPEPIARNHNVIAFKKGDAGLEIALLDINDLSRVDFVKKKVGLKILPRLTDSESIKSMLVQYQKGLKTEFGDLIRQEMSALRAGEMSGGDLRVMAEDLPVVRIVDTLLKHAILQSASDIHIESLEKELLVRYRIDGRLQDAMVLPKEAEVSIVARIKSLSHLKLEENRLPQDGRFKVEMNGEKVSLRVSIAPTFYGEKIVMRLLRENVSGFTLEHLGFHGEALERLHASLVSTKGLILTAGPAGSGKSTTLYTLLDLLNQPGVNISTIENPVEYQMSRVNQTPIRPQIGLTFASALRSIVRQDPDVIMVGEMADNETAHLAVNTALSGRLVLSALPTLSAAKTLTHLLDMKVEPLLLASTTSLVISQRLVRRLADAKERKPLNKTALAALGKIIDLDRMIGILRAEKIIGQKDGWDKVMFGVPQPTGDNDGYRGRIGIHEVLKTSEAIKELIIKHSKSDAIEAQAQKEGMMTLVEDGVFLAAQGLTTIEEVLKVVSE